MKKHQNSRTTCSTYMRTHSHKNMQSGLPDYIGKLRHLVFSQPARVLHAAIGTRSASGRDQIGTRSGRLGSEMALLEGARQVGGSNIFLKDRKYFLGRQKYSRASAMERISASWFCGVLCCIKLLFSSNTKVITLLRSTRCAI